MKKKSVMLDYDKIAVAFAKNTNYYNVVFPCAVNSKEYKYYLLDLQVRPRYLGLPHIIQIDTKGHVEYVEETRKRIQIYNKAIITSAIYL